MHLSPISIQSLYIDPQHKILAHIHNIGQVPLARGEQPPLRQLHAVSVKPTKLIKVFDQFHSLFDLSRPFKTIKPHMIGFSTFVSVLDQMITASDGAGRFCAITTRRLDGMKTTCIALLRGHPVVCYRIVCING